MRLRDLRAGDRFRFSGKSAIYTYYGNGWYNGAPYCGGPWCESGNPEVEIVES